MTEINYHSIEHQNEPKNFIKEYWQDRADNFGALRAKELHSYLADLWSLEISKHLPVGQSLKILDIGCGAGFFSILLAKQGHETIGIDLSPAMVEQARTLAMQENCASCTFSVMDAEHLDFDDATFDIVIARNVTWNLPHPEAAYKEWLRVLKPEGILLNYDAEHARNHHQQQPEHNAHADVCPELLERCHTIYHMLDISVSPRPKWDLCYLSKLRPASIIVDKSVGERLYTKQDDFYIAAPMFCVKVKK